METREERSKRIRAEVQRRYRESHREELKEYKRRWQRENPDKVRAQQERHYRNKAIMQEMEEDNSSPVKAWERVKASCDIIRG